MIFAEVSLSKKKLSGNEKDLSLDHIKGEHVNLVSVI